MRRLYMHVHIDDVRAILVQVENMTAYIGEVIDDEADMDLHDLWQWVNSVLAELGELTHER